MSLNVDYNKVEDKSIFLKEDGEKNDDYIFAVGCLFLSVGMSELTESNFGEFLARVTIWENVFGTMFGNSDGPIPFDEDRTRKLMGVHVNYGKDDTRNQWLKRTVGSKMDDIKRGV